MGCSIKWIFVTCKHCAAALHLSHLDLPQFHFWPLERVATHSCVEGAPPDTIAAVSSTEVLAIEVRVITAIVPPGTLPECSTVDTVQSVVVSVISGELHAVMIIEAVPCSCMWAWDISTNSQLIVGARISNRKILVVRILVMTFKVSEVYSQLCHGPSSRQTVNLLQAQPMFSLHISKPIIIFCPPSVEVLWAVASSLEHGPAPSIVHVTPDREGLPTPWVYGVHSWPSAAQDIGLLAVKGEGVQVGITDCRGDSMKLWLPCSSQAVMLHCKMQASSLSKALYLFM